MTVYGIPERRWKTHARRWAAHLCASLQPYLPGPPPGALGILTYHRLTPRIAGLPRPTWNVEPTQFEAQLRGLLDRGFQPIRLQEALAQATQPTTVYRKQFVVTFDDGFANVHQWALPILARLQIPATVFLATEFIDQRAPFPFEDWGPALQSGTDAGSWRPLSWDECHAMRDSGWIELGSHTHSHRRFAGDPAGFTDDLQRSLETLRERLQIEQPTFSFPFGAFDDSLREVARQSGMACALTTQTRLVRPGEDPFDWGRFGVHSWDTAATLQAKLAGAYDFARNLYQRCRGRQRRPRRAPGPRQQVSLPS